MLRPENYAMISDSVSEEILNKIRFGYYVGTTCPYPRFDLSRYFYKLKANPVYSVLPDKEIKYVDFETVTDTRAIEFKKASEKFEHVYLFWSGGIDSTLVLCALLKNWDTISLSKLTVVLNSQSILEHPTGYLNLIKGKLKELNTDEFFSGGARFSHDALYITGDVGDAILGYEDIYRFDKLYPGSYQRPWKKSVDLLVSYFSLADGPVSGNFAMNHIIESLEAAEIEVDTVYDLLWWLDFNWGYDLNLYYLCWTYSELPQELNARQFMEDNVFLFFNCKEYQNWAVATIGTDLKIGATVTSHKLPAKKYIYGFDRDKEYFDTKLKVMSIPNHPKRSTNNRLFAIDTSYNLYYTEPSIWLNK